MAPRTCIVHVTSCALYTASRMHETPKLDQEKADDYETRTWKHKAHVDPDGNVFIPAAAFKQALDSAIKFRGEKIGGKGNHTWSKHFLAGTLCMDNVGLLSDKGKPLTIEDVACARIHCNADGVRGSGKRVFRMFPEIRSWHACVKMCLLDDVITVPVFEAAFKEAGNFVGVGQYRPQNGGVNGRWVCNKFEWAGF